MSRKENERGVKTIAEGVELLKKQQVIAYPTESVFGLGCDPESEEAVMRLLWLKQRPVNKGLILIASNYQQLKPYVNDEILTIAQKSQLRASWPGPITWVIPALSTTPDWLTGQFNSLAVRVSAHPQVSALCALWGKPLVSTSANIAGSPACRTGECIQRQFGSDFPILEGKVGGRENPSEIRNLLTGELLRQG